MKRFSRTLSWLLCIAMVVAMVPAAVSAVDAEPVAATAINFNDFEKKATDRCTVTIAEDGSTVRLATTSQGNDTYTFQGTNAAIDHSKNLVLSQTITATNLVVGGNPEFVDYTSFLAEGSNDVRNAFQFWMSDVSHASAGTAAVFSLGALYTTSYNYNDYGGKGGLTLRVHKNGSKQYQDIKLDKNVGDTFGLVTRWNADDSVDVYVDGAHKGTVENATVNTTTLFGNDTVGMHYTTNGSKASDVTVSNMTLTAVDNSVMDFSDFKLKTAGSPTVTVDPTGTAVTGERTTSGSKEMTMTKTDYAIDHSKDMVLTQTIDPKQLYNGGNPRFVTVGDTAWFGSSNVMRQSYDFWMSDTTGVAAVFSVGALYNTNLSNPAGGVYKNILLRVHQPGSKVYKDIVLKENDTKPFELAVRWNADNSVDVYVDGAYKETVANATFNDTTLLGTDTVGIHIGSHNCADAPMTVGISNMTLTAVDNSVMDFKDCKVTAQGSPNVAYGKAGSAVTTVIAGGSTNEVKLTDTNAQIDHSKDLLLTQTIDAVQLPDAGNPYFDTFGDWDSDSTGDDMRNGYDFWIGDTESAAAVFSLGGLFHDNSSWNAEKDNPELKLRVHQNGSKTFTDIFLGKHNGDRFDLAVRWNADDSVDVFVDGVHKGTVANATVTTAALFGSDKVGLRAYTTNGTGSKFNFTVSDMSLVATDPIAITSSSLQLEGILRVKFNAPAGNTVKVTVPNVGEQVLTSTDGVYAAKVFAQDMLKDITAQLFDANGILRDTKTFKLTEYAASINASDAPEKTKALTNATLAYCQYAAQYKGNLVGTPNTLDAIPNNAFDSYAYPTSGPAGCSVNAYLEEACQLQLFLPNADYTVKINGVAATIEEKNGKFICSTQQILPQNYAAGYTFSVLKNGEDTPTEVTVNVLAYLNVCLNGNVVTLTAQQEGLMTAMYHYYAAAAAYLAD